MRRVMNITAKTVALARAAQKLSCEQRFRMSFIPWSTYLAISDLLPERHIRLTYEDGELEFMTVSPEHERRKKLLARLLEALPEVLDIDIASGGSMTFRRETIECALEPDECYWIAHERAARNFESFNLEHDPPPDLAIEVEISRSLLNRVGIYAQLGVPELWRFDGQTLLFCVLGSGKRYRDREKSLAFPFLRAAQLQPFLFPPAGESETKTVRRFRQWVSEQQAAGWKTPPRADA